MDYDEYENLCEEEDEMTDQESEDDTSSRIKLGVSRYKNIMGVTCYMNSILHILQQIPLFVNYIYSFEFEDILLYKIGNTNKLINNYVIYELHRLFKASINNDNSIITPVTFKKLIGIKNDMWDEINHQDSQEFFNFLISQIKEDIGVKKEFINLKCDYQDRTISESINNLIASDALTKFQSFEYSSLSELFDGLYKNSCSCSFCKSNNLNFEPFLTLGVDINNNNNLYECLDELCSDQQLDINNKITCDFCGLPNRALKKTLFWKTPKILVIHIKRFGNGQQKNTTNINYPVQNLDLSKYIDQESPYKLYCKYDLIGINIHLSLGMDENINSGHYISFVKSMMNNNWYIYNDSDEPEELEDDLQNNDAYLLFYYRQN